MIANEYLKVVQKRFEEMKQQGDRVFKQLSGEDFHWTLNETSNSIAVIVKHMSGNMISRWTDFLTTDGEKPDRNRDDEFTDDIHSDDELVAVWKKGWNALFTAIEELKTTDLLEGITIRGEKLTVIDAIERQIVHYASHIGQIVYIAKQLKDKEWKTLSIPKGK